VKDEVSSDFAAFGAPQELIEMHTASDALEIWPENVETVSAFLRLQTQWVLGAMGGVVGLNYQAVEALFNILGIEKRLEVFDGLQVMERAALAVLNRKD
jgi:hypothetical protein